MPPPLTIHAGGGGGGGGEPAGSLAAGGATKDTGRRGGDGGAGGAKRRERSNSSSGAGAGGDHHPGRWRRLLGNPRVHRLARLVFESVQVAAVAATLIVVAVDAEVYSGRRTSATDGTYGAVRLAELAAVTAFLLEAAVLVVARGLVLLPGACLRDPSIVFCFSLTALSATCLWALGGAGAAGEEAFWVTVARAARALNVFRLLRLVRMSDSLADLLNALRSSGKALCLAGGVVLCFWLQWAIVGLEVRTPLPE